MCVETNHQYNTKNAKKNQSAISFNQYLIFIMMVYCFTKEATQVKKVAMMTTLLSKSTAARYFANRTLLDSGCRCFTFLRDLGHDELRLCGISLAAFPDLPIPTAFKYNSTLAKKRSRRTTTAHHIDRMSLSA